VYTDRQTKRKNTHIPTHIKTQIHKHTDKKLLYRNGQTNKHKQDTSVYKPQSLFRKIFKSKSNHLVTDDNHEDVTVSGTPT